MLYNIIIAIITIICALLTLVILLQNGQGEGLAGMGGGGLDGSAGLGARRTADILSKSTTILGGAFLVLCVLANFAIDRQQPTESILQQGAPINDIAAPSTTQSAVPTTTPPPPVTGNENNDSGNE